MIPWLPQNVSAIGAEADSLFYIILVITGIIFVVVEVALLWFIFKYRHREGRRADPVHGNVRAEIVWTAIPLILVAAIGFISRPVWHRMKYEDRFPDPALEVKVHAQQFEWIVTYPGADGQLDTNDDFTQRNVLNAPVNRVVRIRLTAEDVIHSFFLPQLRVKQDAVPGMTIPVWFQANTPGEYVLGCAELCGQGHYRMRGRVLVQSDAEFQQWLAGRRAE